jgi:hypothetical protein
MLVVGGAGLFSGRTPEVKAAAQTENGISPEALAQIDALIKEKESRTGVQTKLDSQLVYELKMRHGQQVAEGVQAVETDLPYTDLGKVTLDIKATVSDSLLNQLRAKGAAVISASAGNSVRVEVSIDQVEAIAALPEVDYIQPKQEAMTSSIGGQEVTDDRHKSKGRAKLDRYASKYELSPAFESRAANAREAVALALQGGAFGNVSGAIPPTGVGSRSSEGDLTHRAFSARGTFNTNGTGIKIGVLSDGVTNLATSQARGDLGPVTIIPGQAGSGDEGTAMLEIIHDLAPGAQLYFATAFTSITSFANNIRALRTAGCDIIVDDVFYFVETPFQDGQLSATNTNGGVVIQAVNDVTAAGALYFSSAGNSGNKNDGTSGVWEGNFADGGPTATPLPAGNLHNFGGQNFTAMTLVNTSGAPINLYWSDALGGSSNDYDLFRLNAAGTAVQASSTNIQNGTQDPYEQVNQSAAVVGSRIVIVKKASAAPRFLHLNANRGRFSINTNGQTHGHSAAADAFGCAATPASGPFPNPFSATNLVETFSSDGPRRVFYQANGAPYTPGDFSASGGQLRQKPDITAADGVSVTGVGNFPSPFFGTSAAAPHAAAIAGLIKAANPALTPAQIRTALISSAIDIEAAGVDRDSGAGIIMAYNALLAAGIPGTAYLELATVTATENPGDGNGILDAGDGARLDIQLRNSGVLNATAISATLSTSTPGVTITLPNGSAYPDLTAGGGTGNNLTPFLFTIGNTILCPATINFSLTVTYTGGLSPQVLNFTVPVGPPPVNLTSSIDAIAPAPGAGFTTQTGTIGTRHFRDGVASVCGVVKAFPGTTAPGTRQFDSYTFTTCSSSAPSCVTVTLSGTNAINLYTAAYTGTFNSANLALNFLADAGSSAASRTYSFNIAGGAQTFTVVVYDVNPGAPSGTAYALNVSGTCIGACPTPNQVPVAKCKNVTVSADASCQANASINDGSFDPDGDPLTITQSPAGPYPLGTTSVLLTVTDPRGATSQCTATVTVVDTTAPSVSCNVAISTISLLNHDLIDVGLTASAADNCDPNLTLVVQVFGDENDEEATGDGNHSPDAKGIAPGTLRLRGERKANGDGRVYLVVVTARDAAGNLGRCSKTIVIPHNNSQNASDSVNAQAAAAKAYYDANGTMPPGYFLIGDGPILGPKQ